MAKPNTLTITLGAVAVVGAVGGAALLGGSQQTGGGAEIHEHAERRIIVVNVAPGKAEIRDDIAPRLARMREICDEHLPIWRRLSRETKLKLIREGRHPVVKEIWPEYMYLDTAWFGEVRQ